MPSIPKNNLKERMLKLNYNPDLVMIVPPVLDNSKIIIPQEKPKTAFQPNFQTTYQPVKEDAKETQDFKPPTFINVDDWSDFEDDDS